MAMKIDKTVERCIALIKETVEPLKMDGYVWYDMTDQGFEAELKLLRVSGEIAHHPLIHALVRFN